MKYFVGVVVVALLAVVAYYAWDAYKGMEPTSVPPSEQQEPAAVKYATSTFSVEYPSDFTIDSSYAYEGVPNKPIDGVKFTVPARMAAGTNLSDDSGVSVEWLPRAKSCTGDIYVLPNVKAYELQTASTTYSVATTSEGAAGNVYEEQVYAIKDSSPCTAVRYFIHSSNFQNYFPQEGEPATIQEYDRAALLRTFDAIRNSLVLY